MKTLQRILLILLVALVIAGIAYLALDDSPFESSGGNRHGQGKGGQSSEEEGEELNPRQGGGGEGHYEVSIGQGLREIFGMLVKVTGITILVLGIQYFFRRIKRGRGSRSLSA